MAPLWQASRPCQVISLGMVLAGEFGLDFPSFFGVGWMAGPDYSSRQAPTPPERQARASHEVAPVTFRREPEPDGCPYHLRNVKLVSFTWGTLNAFGLDLLISQLSTHLWQQAL